MRILMITPWFPVPKNTTSGIFVLRDAQALSAQHDVRVIHLDSMAGAHERAGDDTIGGISVHRLPFTRLRLGDWSRARAAVRLAARDVHVVHSHALTGILPFAFRRPAGRTPWVHTEHWSGLTSPETLTPRGRFARRVMMPLLSRPDVVVVAAERLSATIRKVRRRPIVNVPCVVDQPSVILPAPRDPQLLRLIGVGGLIQRKGPLRALEAVHELDRRGIRASLTWVGEGPQREEMIAEAARVGLSDRLHLTGSLNEAQVGEQLDASDVFVLPTLGDNFCIVVAEALSHGRPVVSGADTGAVDYCDPLVSEFVDRDDAVEYANAIERIADRTSTVSADDIADTVRGAFSPDRVAELLIDAYVQAGARGR